MVGALLAQEGPLRPRAVPAQEHPQARRRERVVPGGYEALEDPHQNVGDEEHPPLNVTVEVTDASGMNSLHWLTVEGHASVAQWLLDEVHAGVDSRDSMHGQTALHLACAKGKATMAKLLVHRGADPVKPDNAGWTPLHAVARSGFTDVAVALLDVLAPAQLNLPGADGQTALHRAAYWGNAEVAALLVQRGADTQLTDSRGLRAYDVVCQGGERHALLPTLLKMLRRPLPQ